MVGDQNRHMMKSNRKIGPVQQMFVLNGVKANVGPMRSFRFFMELVGDYEDVGCRSVDFKNYVRDLRAYGDGVDAQILIDKFKNKSEFGYGFKFEYYLDDSDKLKRLFWADCLGIQNYNIFGEAVSFDATYETKRYNMIFTAFTGKDNHGRCITFAAALISNEDVDSYSWVLSNFVDCMGKHPKMLITDQDPALKKAVENVMPHTRYRYCMWHIMMKVAEKLPVVLRGSSDFKEKFDSVVWSEYDDAYTFEDKWSGVMQEFGLGGHKWFDHMYELRSYWIPAFFRDLEMSGLFRTTSLSESENSFFRRYMNCSADLVQFYLHFSNAIKAQRNAHDQHSFFDETRFPEMETELAIERHATSFYTNKMFFVVQHEIKKSIYGCIVSTMKAAHDGNVFSVEDEVNGIFDVTYIAAEDEIFYSCRHFIKHGLLCMHMFAVMRHLKMKTIPEKYIIRRWTKMACADFVRPRRIRNVSGDEKISVGINNLFASACRCIGLVDGNEEHMEKLLQQLNEWGDSFVSSISISMDAEGKKKRFQKFYGAPIPNDVNIHPPSKGNNKGRRHRFKSTKEKEAERANKPKRLCRKCNQNMHHDTRNCDQVPPKKKKC